MPVFPAKASLLLFRMWLKIVLELHLFVWLSLLLWCASIVLHSLPPRPLLAQFLPVFSWLPVLLHATPWTLPFTWSVFQPRRAHVAQNSCLIRFVARHLRFWPLCPVSSFVERRLPVFSAPFVFRHVLSNRHSLAGCLSLCLVLQCKIKCESSVMLDLIWNPSYVTSTRTIQIP